MNCQHTNSSEKKFSFCLLCSHPSRPLPEVPNGNQFSGETEPGPGTAQLPIHEVVQGTSREASLSAFSSSSCPHFSFPLFCSPHPLPSPNSFLYLCSPLTPAQLFPSLTYLPFLCELLTFSFTDTHSLSPSCSQSSPVRTLASLPFSFMPGPVPPPPFAQGYPLLPPLLGQSAFCSPLLTVLSFWSLPLPGPGTGS